jgi:gliding motility-associated-like protein
MTKKILFFLLVLTTFKAQSQIVIDNLVPYNTPVYLIDNVLLGGGVVASNHTFQGGPSQIGWFNGVNTNLGIDSGIVMCTGDIYALDPINGGGFPFLPNTVTDPDLLAVANSVPGMIGQSFSVSSINDVAVLEFDFIPTSDSMEFRYAFGSQEYFGFENTQYNDVFGFFLSGPGIAGPWANGAINLAVVPNTNPPLPISISSVNSVTPINQQYFVNNQSGLNIIADADGFTTVFTAQALVQCGATYHIKLAIADGSDQGLSSYVWLEAGSFYSPPLVINNDLNIDSNILNIACNSTVILTADGGIGANYQWFNATTSIVISTDSFVIVGEGQYVVSANISGCAILSDTLIVIADPAPTIDLGANIIIPCNSDILIVPVVFGGTSPYSYLWNSGDTDSMLVLAEGVHSVVVTDILGCSGNDTLAIIYDPPPVVDLGVDYNIPCNTSTVISPTIVGGTAPYTYAWSNGDFASSIDISEGNYILTVLDFYACSDSDTINITEDPIPQATISGGGSVCDDGSTAAINFTFNGLLPWDLTYTNGSVSSTSNDITSSNYSISTSIAGNYAIVLADDVNDCIASSSGIANVIVNPLPIAVITPNEITIYFGEEIALTTTETYIFYEWYTEYGDSISNEEILTVQDSGRYKVWVEDGNGCTDMSELAIVRSVPLTQLFIPLAFTPNDDEHNELFVIKGLYIQTFNIKIFDRWGNQLFESDAIDKYWDGTFENKKVQQGTYYYHLEVLGLDSKLFEKSGNIQVLY